MLTVVLVTVVVVLVVTVTVEKFCGVVVAVAVMFRNAVVEMFEVFPSKSDSNSRRRSAAVTLGAGGGIIE